MNVRWRKVAGIVACLAIGAVARNAGAFDEAAFVEWARSRAVMLPAAGASGEHAWKESMRRSVGAARVVALGEPAHGAHEPLAFRNRLLAYLVEELGFTAIALESGFGESQRLCEYVMGAPGDAVELARTGFTWGFGAYGENAELLRWIREYNDDPAHRRKVRIYGIDLTGGDGDRFQGSRIALDQALAYLAGSAPQAHRALRAEIEPFLARFTRTGYLELGAGERRKLRSVIERLITVFDEQRESLLAATSSDSYEWARHNAVSALQLEEFFRLWPAEAPPDRVSVEFMDAGIARDAAMAANVQWAMEREGHSGRLMLFAHDAHVMSTPLTGGIWSIYPRPLTVMGQRLHAALGDQDLLIVATASLENGPGLPARPAGSGSLDLALGGVSRSPFLLDVRGEKSDGAAAWLASPQTLAVNFDTEERLAPSTAFDVVVMLGRLNPAAKSEAAEQTPAAR